jgi:hypothetical protein
MDLQLYEQVITSTLENVSLNTDSILEKTHTKLKQYLEENTSITDDKKASIYAEFLANTTTSVVTEAVRSAMQIALDGPVNDATIQKITTETTIAQAQSDKDLAVKDSEISVNGQKIASMQEEDIARKNEVAAKVAKAKIEIEELIPSQVALNQKELTVKDKEIQIREKQVLVEEKRAGVEEAKIPLMQAQANVETQKVALMVQQTSVEEKKVSLMDKEVALKAESVNVEREKVGVMKAQVQAEQAKIPLIQAQTDMERARAAVEEKKVPLIIKQTEVEGKKIPMMEAQIETEKEKLKLTREEIQLRMADILYRREQARTVGRSLIVNERIEKCKCETQLKIAALQTAAL